MSSHMCEFLLTDSIFYIEFLVFTSLQHGHQSQANPQRGTQAGLTTSNQFPTCKLIHLATTQHNEQHLIRNNRNNTLHDSTSDVCYCIELFCLCHAETVITRSRGPAATAHDAGPGGTESSQVVPGRGKLGQAKFGVAEFATTKVCQIRPWCFKVRSHFSGVIFSALGLHISIVPNNTHPEASRK